MTNNLVPALEYLAQKKGLNSEQTAKRLCISRQNWFARRKKPDMFRLEELKTAAKTFGVDITICKDGNVHVDFEL